VCRVDPVTRHEATTDRKKCNERPESQSVGVHHCGFRRDNKEQEAQVEPHDGGRTKARKRTLGHGGIVAGASTNGHYHPMALFMERMGE
jgi:hypothetical protein